MCSCAFQRTVYAHWQCVVFFRKQFYARWQCAIFSREQFVFPVPYKGISLIFLVFALVLCGTVKKPTSRLTSIDKLTNPGIVFQPSKLW